MPVKNRVADQESALGFPHSIPKQRQDGHCYIEERCCGKRARPKWAVLGDELESLENVDAEIVLLLLIAWVVVVHKGQQQSYPYAGTHHINGGINEPGQHVGHIVQPDLQNHLAKMSSFEPHLIPSYKHGN